MIKRLMPSDAPTMPDAAEAAAETMSNTLRFLRGENTILTERLRAAEIQLGTLETENAMLDKLWRGEKLQRERYQAFSIEVSASLGLLADACDGVIRKAREQALHIVPGKVPAEPEQPRQELPQSEKASSADNGEPIPDFLRLVQEQQEPQK
jgi:hypothetical protein